MESSEKIEEKNKLKAFGLDLIGRRIRTAQQSINDAQEAANQEEKSSAGDKYETGRAMGHLQKDMFARQLEEHTREMATLHAVRTDTLYTAATAGALLQCSDICLFLSAGLGKQVIDGKTVLFLSPGAPLAKQLKDKRKGDSFSFNGRQQLILDIY